MQLVIEAREVAKKLTPVQVFLAKYFGKKIYLCHEGPEKHEGWTGSLPFYLFWCSGCEHWAKDYPGGFPEERRLCCSNCSARYSFIQLRTRLKIVIGFIQSIRQILAAKKKYSSRNKNKR